jgi:Tfp pilus assembly protein PilF
MRMFWASLLLPVLMAAQSVPPSYSTAAALFQKQDFAAAAPALDRALRENPDYVPALMLKARLSMIDGQMEQARAALDHVLSRAPGTRDARFLLGFLYYLQNDFEAADTALAAADQNDPRVLLYRAMSAEGLNRRESAHDFYQRAIHLDDRGTDARIAYARLLRREGAHKEEAKLIDEALALSPASRDVLYEKGLCLLENRKYLDAARFGEKALDASGPVPTEREIRYLLVRAWQKAGDTNRAAQERALFEKLPMPLVR